LQSTCCANYEVVSWKWCVQVNALDTAVQLDIKVQGVAPIHQHKNRLQKVIAICPTASDVQEQVELGGR
jgi:hypothetical protein